MTILFGRSYRLIVGPRGENGREFTKLDMSFTVEQTSEANENRSEITVINLNPDSRGFIEDGQFCILFCGYGDEPEYLTSGDITKLQTYKEKTDFITKFEVGDGQKNLREKFVNKSYVPGTTLQKVVTDTAKAIGSTVTISKQLGTQVFNNGLTVSGKAKDVLSNLLDKQKFEYSIVNNELRITKRGEASIEDVVQITSDTGLIGSPRKREKSEKADKKAEFSGIEFKSLLNAKLFPGRRVEVISRQFQGTFLCRKVTHQGQSRGGEWISMVEAIEE